MTRLRSTISPAKLASPMRVAYAGGAIAVVALLLNSPGVAIVLASLVVPVIALLELPRRDLDKRDPAWSAPAALGWGVLVGLVAGTLGAATVAGLWIEGAPLHVGAAGFGGAAADRAGSPGFLVLFVNGILLSAGGVAVASLGPVWLRRFPLLRNEVMDGVALGVAAGCGLATGTAIIQVFPMLRGSTGQGASVADWTAMLLGLLVTRPVILGLLTALVCAGLWHATLSRRTADLAVPVAAGMGGAVVFAFGDLLLQPRGARVELLWHILVAAALVVVARFVLRRALAHDRIAIGGAARVVCPACGASTPAGAFCASCGAALPAERPALPTVEAEPIVVEETIEAPPADR